MSNEKRDALFLMMIGALIMALCGTCTFNVTVGSHDPETGIIAPFSLVIGGGCVIIGLVLFLNGWRGWRGTKPPPDPGSSQ